VSDFCREAATHYSPGLCVARNPPWLSAVVSGKVGRRRKSGGPRRVFWLFWSFSTTGCHFSSFVSFSQHYGGQAGHVWRCTSTLGAATLWAKADEVSGDGMAAVSGDVANHDRDDFAIAVVASALARAWNCSDRARQMA
jgi:hypothetical protein